MRLPGIYILEDGLTARLLDKPVVDPPDDIGCISRRWEISIVLMVSPPLMTQGSNGAG